MKTLIKRHWAIYLLSGLLPFAIMFIVFAILGVYPFGQSTVMAIDFASQYIDLFGYMKQAILNLDFGGFFYSFSKSIGGDMLGLTGYYLLSPFNLVYVILPIEEFRIAATLTILLRYFAMGVTFSHLLITRYDALKRRSLLIPIFSTVYALMGFTVAYQMNPIWMDALVMLPLVIIGVEKVLDGKSATSYVASLAAMIMMQYYMGFMICVFIVMYAFYYMSGKYSGTTRKEKLRSYFKPIIRLGCYSLLAVGIAAITLYPIVQNLIMSKGTYTGTLVWKWEFVFNPLDVLSKTMMGAFNYKQMPTGLPNVYIAAIAMIGFIAFFRQKQFKRAQKIAAAIIMLLFVISMAHDFTNKLWHLGQTPAWFFHRFSYLTSFFMILLGYQAVRDYKKTARLDYVIFGLVIVGINVSVFFQNADFMNVYKQLGTTFFWIAIVILLSRKKTINTWLMILLLTIIETGANAYLTQSSISYAHAGSFKNAYTVMHNMMDVIRPSNEEFYRIATTFSRGKNDPLMHMYPGLTHFSSNAEAATLDFFDYMGDSGTNASTNYGAPTLLTEALYNIRYTVQLRNYSAEEKQDPNIYKFTRTTTRKNMYDNYRAAYESDRFRVYENSLTLPIAFGVSDRILNVELKSNQPAQNQNRILQAFSGREDISYFTGYAFNNKTVENMIEGQGNDEGKYTRENKEATGSVSFYFTPQTNEAYYIGIPVGANKPKDEIQLLLNDQTYEYYRPFDHRQLWTLAYDQAGEEIKFTFATSKLDDLTLRDVQLWRANGADTIQAIKERAQQGMTVTKRSSNRIEGTVNITDDSAYLMTSIPYSQGWHVLVDGVPVTPIAVLETLMAVPITSGAHTIVMTYTSVGFTTGMFISMVSLATLSVIIVRKGREYETL